MDRSGVSTFAECIEYSEGFFRGVDRSGASRHSCFTHPDVPQLGRQQRAVTGYLALGRGELAQHLQCRRRLVFSEDRSGKKKGRYRFHGTRGCGEGIARLHQLAGRVSVSVLREENTAAAIGEMSFYQGVDAAVVRSGLGVIDCRDAFREERLVRDLT